MAEEIRRRDSKVLIMFITHMAQMAIRGYEVQAVDFVLKPVNKYALLLKMQRIRKSLSQRKEAFFLVPDDGGVRKISSRELYYVEVSGHYLYYHAKSGVYKQKSPLRQIEEELTSLSFRKCNNCYLVNLRHVNAVRKEEVQIGTEWLKISRSRQESVSGGTGGLYGRRRKMSFAWGPIQMLIACLMFILTVQRERRTQVRIGAVLLRMPLSMWFFHFGPGRR